MSVNIYRSRITMTRGDTAKIKISKADGTLLRKFVPCYRTSDSVVGLYDTINGIFYPNAGTGTFTYGVIN